MAWAVGETEGGGPGLVRGVTRGETDWPCLEPSRLSTMFFGSVNFTSGGCLEAIGGGLIAGVMIK